MALLDMMVHPIREGLAKPGMDRVGQPQPRQKVEFLLFGEVVHQIGILGRFLEHPFNGDVLVLRAVDLSVLIRFDA